MKIRVRVRAQWWRPGCIQPEVGTPNRRQNPIGPSRTGISIGCNPSLYQEVYFKNTSQIFAMMVGRAFIGCGKLEAGSTALGKALWEREGDGADGSIDGYHRSKESTGAPGEDPTPLTGNPPPPANP